MAILRKCNKEKYTTILQSITMDSRLSLKDLGLLVKLLSLPDNWNFSEKGLEKILEQDGQTSIRTAIKNLEKYGYLKRVRVRESGKMIGIEWYIFEEPQTEKKVENPHCENHNLENANWENQPQYNTKEYNTKELIKEKNIKVSKKEKTETEENTTPPEQKRETYNEIILTYTDNPQLQQTLKEYIKMRAMKKSPLTNKGLRLLLNELKKFSSSELYQIGMLEKAIMNGSNKLYELTNSEAESVWQRYQKGLDKFFD